MKNKFLLITLLIYTLLTGCSSIKESTQRAINVKATQSGYSPSEIIIPNDTERVTLRFKRVTDHTCAREVIYEDQSINKKLPLNKPVEVTFNTKGTDEIVYGCHMNKMHKGIIKKKK